MTFARFRQLEEVLRAIGFGPQIDWSEQINQPSDADEFACRVIYVICNSGMRVTIAAPIAERCVLALQEGRSATEIFGHPGKASAIDLVWQQRHALFEGYLSAAAKLDFLGELSWIGRVTKHHLAKNLGLAAAKPDVHLVRLANREGTTPQRLCRRLARLSGYKITTVDTILWRACADGILNSRRYELEGWAAAFAQLGSDEEQQHTDPKNSAAGDDPVLSQPD